MEPSADEQLYGWVQKLVPGLWIGAPVVHVQTSKMVPTKDAISLHRLLRLSKVQPDKIKDPVQVVHSEGQFLIYDGHYQWALATLNRRNMMEVHMIETEDEVEITGHVHPNTEDCREGCPKYEPEL